MLGYGPEGSEPADDAVILVVALVAPLDGVAVEAVVKPAHGFTSLKFKRAYCPNCFIAASS